MAEQIRQEEKERDKRNQDINYHEWLTWGIFFSVHSWLPIIALSTLLLVRNVSLLLVLYGACACACV